MDSKVKAVLGEFATPSQIIKREFSFDGVSCTALFQPDITDALAIRSIIRAAEGITQERANAKCFVEQVLNISEVEVLTDVSKVSSKLLNGDTVIFCDAFSEIIVCNTKAWDKRAVAEPPSEVVTNGPREGFIEDFKTNLSLIARRLKSPSLAVEKMVIGRSSATNVAVIYLKNIAKPDVIDRIMRRLKQIDIDSIIDVHSLEPFLDDRPFSIFRQSGVSEKPDVVAGKLLEGRVAVMIDGSPLVLTFPFIFSEDFHAAQDYYQRHSYSTFIRLLRFFSVFIAIFLPALYVAVQEFNFDILPIKFLITLMDATKGTPMSPLQEMLFVVLLFEIIREASVRMPRSVGMAMSIVGALVLGDTAVKAGLISSPSIMITALSSITLYLVPQQISTLALVRLSMIVVGGFLGLYGLVCASVFLVHYLSNLDTYGTPYLAPFAPFIASDMKDSLMKDPITNLKSRPKSIPNINETRQK